MVSLMMRQGVLRAQMLIRRWVKEGFLEEAMLVQVFKMRKEKVSSRQGGSTGQQSIPRPIVQGPSSSRAPVAEGR